MKFHILVAYDGSDESAKAVKHACEIGRAMNALITVVHAVQPNIYEATSGEVHSLSNFADKYRREILRTIDQAEERGEAYLAEAEEIAEEADQEVTTELLYGDPVNKIIEYADAEDIDLIILGHRGQSERPDAPLGSIAKAIIERANVPVTVHR